MQPADIFPLDLTLVPIRLLNTDSITWRLNPLSLLPLFDVTTLWSQHYCGQCQPCDPYADRHDFTQPCATGNKKKLSHVCRFGDQYSSSDVTQHRLTYLPARGLVRMYRVHLKYFNKSQEWVIHIKQRKERLQTYVLKWVTFVFE